MAKRGAPAVVEVLQSRSAGVPARRRAERAGARCISTGALAIDAQHSPPPTGRRRAWRPALLPPSSLHIDTPLPPPYPDEREALAISRARGPRHGARADRGLQIRIAVRRQRCAGARRACRTARPGPCCSAPSTPRAAGSAGGRSRDVSYISTLTVLDPAREVSSDSIGWFKAPLHAGAQARMDSIGLPTEVRFGIDAERHLDRQRRQAGAGAGPAGASPASTWSAACSGSRCRSASPSGRRR